jgi:hypothetical protein
MKKKFCLITRLTVAGATALLFSITVISAPSDEAQRTTESVEHLLREFRKNHDIKELAKADDALPAARNLKPKHELEIRLSIVEAALSIHPAGSKSPKVVTFVDPPKGYEVGTHPSQIKDAKERQEYLERINANQANAQKADIDRQVQKKVDDLVFILRFVARDTVQQTGALQVEAIEARQSFLNALARSTLPVKIKQLLSDSLNPPATK